MPPRTDRPEDEESSLSDYDSEWTQVSGAEDDSDFPPLTAASDRPLSRADTFDGSVDGDIWEGFVDGIHRSSSLSSDQMRLPDANIDIDATVETLPPHDTQLVCVSAVPETEDHDSVNEALDSELIGTLKSSRARSTSSLHTSLTESQSKLRLSFPDPLCSREDLDGDSAPQEGSVPSESGKEHYENSATEDGSSVFEDLHTPLTSSDSEAPGEIEPAPLPLPASATCALSLFLYGSASSSKWQIAERIMKLVFRRTDGAPSTVEDGSQRDYYFKHYALLGDAANAENEQIFFIRVLDRTSNSSEVIPEVDEQIPSIAILLLPSRLPAVLPRHKYYLPLISASSLDFGCKSPVISSTFSEQVVVDSAHYTWKKLDLPTEDVIVLDQQQPHAILDAAALESVDPDVLSQAFSVVLNNTKEVNSSSTYDQLRLFTNRWKTIALIAAALIALAAGGIQVGRSSSLTPVAANTTSTGVIDGPTTVLDSVRTVATFVVPANHLIQTTRSLPRTLATTVAKTTMHSTARPPDGGSEPSKLAIVTHDGTPSRAASSLTESPSPKPSTCHSRTRAWVDKFNLSLGEYIPRDLIVWPVDTFGIVGKKSALIPRPVRSLSSDKSSGDIVKSLSLRTVQNSLAVVSSKGKALRAMAGKDLSILYEAIDELVRGLQQQIDNAKDEMKGTRPVTQSGFSTRNTRAKENARRLRRAGEHFFQAAGKCLRNKGEEVIRAAGQSRHSRRRGGKLMREQGATSAEDDKAAKKDMLREKEHGRSVKHRQPRVRRASE